MVKLEDCKLITNEEYNVLADSFETEFVGQTRMDENNMYYMCWRINGALYKTHNTL